MLTKQSDEERLAFSRRLISSLRDSGMGESSTKLAAGFNLRNPAGHVTVHGVRKWITGDSIPTHDKVIVLARWLGVSPSWLRFGSVEEGESMAPALAAPHAALISDIALLTREECLVVRVLVDALIKLRA